jgi:hypothetical protein
MKEYLTGMAVLAKGLPFVEPENGRGSVLTRHVLIQRQCDVEPE